MPAPIPIAMAPSRLDSHGAQQRPGGRTPRAASSFLGGSSFKEAMAVSYGKDVSEIMDYSIARFGTSTESDVTVAPSSVRLESTFCRNFTCCGAKLDDLHDLLQHYEECHVRFEDDEMPAMVADDEVESSGSSSSPASQPTSPRTSNASAVVIDGKDDSDKTSAFDTTVMRSPSLSKGKKRSFGQYANAATANPNGTVHQSLRRALIDGGVGRRNSASSSIYSPNSPFSTPGGGSIPGSPAIDSDNDGYFANGLNPAAFSALSIRSNNTEEHHLPSCAPPNLFFPAPGGASSSQPPAKREKTASTVSASTLALENALKAGAANADKPYKCPASGCDKAYKQMNGLKYHRLHGHCNQNMLPITAQAAAQAPTLSLNTASTSSSPQPESADVKAEEDDSASRATSPSPDDSVTSSPDPSSPASNSAIPLGDRLYICQVGACGKRYKNLNGLRYHYLHSGSHGLLGLQLLQTGGGASAKVDASGRAPVSTSTLSQEEIAAAAQAAQLAQEQIQAQAAKNAAATAAAAASAANAAPLSPPSQLTQSLMQAS